MSFIDLSCHGQFLCTDSDAVPRRVSSLRRRRSLRSDPARSTSAQHELSESVIETDMDNAEPAQLYATRTRNRRRILSTDMSADALRHQLDDTRNFTQHDAELEFPSDVLLERKLEAFDPRDQARHAYRPSINPRDTSIVLFPGQSSQFVGMGAQLLAYPTVEKMYKTASNILGYNLLDMCLYGPKDVLSKTAHSQLAVLVTSLAAVEKLKEVCPQVC